MKIDKKTGEILSFLPQSNKDIVELKTVLDCAINEDVAAMFPKEARGKVLWMNEAQNTLRESLIPDSRHYFEEVCSMIPAQNYLIATRDDLAEHLNVKSKHVNKLLTQWKEAGLIRVLKKDHVKRGRHIYIINPTIVWKGYLHKGAEDSLDHVMYSSTYRFSTQHRKAVEAWVNMYITRYYKGISVEDFQAPDRRLEF